MKNDMHPLIQALKRRGKPEENVFRPQAPDRLFQIEKQDIPSAKRFSPGDDIHVGLHGKVRSMHDDGSMMIHVHRVEQKPDEEVAEAPKSNIVTTQESHAP